MENILMFPPVEEILNGKNPYVNKLVPELAKELNDFILRIYGHTDANEVKMATNAHYYKMVALMRKSAALGYSLAYKEEQSV